MANMRIKFNTDEDYHEIKKLLEKNDIAFGVVSCRHIYVYSTNNEKLEEILENVDCEIERRVIE